MFEQTFKNIVDAVADLGGDPAAVMQAFSGFQKHLYVGQLA